MKRTPGRVLTGTTVLVLTLAGCGIGGGGDSGSADQAGRCAVNEAVASGEPLTGDPKGEITFQTTGLKADFSDYFEKVISEFEALHPGTTVKWQDDPGDSSFTQRLVTDAQSCTLPDVVNLNQTTAYALAKENFLVDVDEAQPGIGDTFIPSIYDSLVMPGDDAGEHYVLPWYWGLTGLQTFNTDLMTRAGLDPAKPPTTVLEQFDDAEQIAKASGGQYYAFSANPMFRLPSDWQLMDVAVTNEDETAFTFADDPKAVEWVQRMADLYQAGALPKDSLSSSDDPTTLYTQGKTVWGSTNASSLRYVQEGNPGVYGTTGVAPLLDARNAALEDGQLIGVTSTGKNPVTALAFADYLLSVDKQNEFISDPRIQNFPSTTDSLQVSKLTDITGSDALATANKVAVGLAPQAKNAFIYSWSDAVNSAVVSEVQKAMQGDKSPQQALTDAQDAANDILANGS